MGSRHAQSLIKTSKSDIIVVELSYNNYVDSCSRIGVQTDFFDYHKSLDSVSKKVDFAIVATNSHGRYGIVLNLLSMGIQKLLLEKVVFQSVSEYEIVLDKVAFHNANVFCNFKSRYYPNYIKLKSETTGKKINMVVSGGRFGLACNSLHYIDLATYITNKHFRIIKSNISKDKKGSPRGNLYKEIIGAIYLQSDFEDNLVIISDESKIYGNEIFFDFDSTLLIFNEHTGKEIRFINDQLDFHEFQILNTSDLISTIFENIFQGVCLLPSLAEAYYYHKDLFECINPLFGLSKDDLCLIT